MMEKREASEIIQNAWADVSPKWSASVKAAYFRKLLIPLLNESDGMYQRNDNIEEYAHNCVQAVTGGSEL